HQSDVTFDFYGKDAKMIIHNKTVEKWKVTLIDTGLETQTGGRLKRIESFIKNEPFMVTYGDAVADIDIRKLVDFHLAHKKSVTVTAVSQPGRFGILEFGHGDEVKSFKEKPSSDSNVINGGFFVLNPDALKYITKGDSALWEDEPLEQLAKKKQLQGYKHQGFWKCMDTLRDKKILEELWKSGKAPWKIWD
ncbi:MAG: glucose-1-phosphate cytidylyltransferase, partial [Candidatus Omnitrophica bacterium]|nr:glucose-1-phosphate cytidylyltransferase [Candidatus Omnitrophota bacterium]